MSLKCGECGPVNWSNETFLSGGVYSGDEDNGAIESSDTPRGSTFFKALLYSFLIELIVLVITLGPISGSFFRHTAAAPRNFWSELLAAFGLLFHFFSIWIAGLFDLFIIAPLIQIALMTALLTLLFRWQKSRAKGPRSIFR